MRQVKESHLTVLNRADVEVVKGFVEDLLPHLQPQGLEVIENRTGLVMLPATDTAKGSHFHLGEVLVSEARVRLAGTEGYTACLGRDLEQSLAIAILDAALRADLHTDSILGFIENQRQELEATDAKLMAQVEATRIEMETF